MPNQPSCEVCGTTLNLVKHHVSYEPEVKIILCRKHHAETHANDRRKSKVNTLLLGRTGVTYIHDVIKNNLQIDEPEIPYIICPDIVLLYNPDRLNKLTENLEYLLTKVYHMGGDLDKVKELINTTGKGDGYVVDSQSHDIVSHGKVAPRTFLSLSSVNAAPEKVNKDE